LEIVRTVVNFSGCKRKKVAGDILSKEERSKRMSLVKSKDTKPELFVRKLVHSLGYRYRLHKNKLPGKPDLAFKSKQKVIFVHGCFWHLHDCGTYNLPKSRKNFWLPKLQANADRDINNKRKLKNAGFEILEIWECELKDVESLKTKIINFLG
jgi:DNA mismatch endonuclease, patch repair protein